MARRKAPVIPDALLDQLLAGRDPQAALGKDWTCPLGVKGWDENVMQLRA